MKQDTKEQLTPPQAETFEAHGYVWYRHVPGDAQPVEPTKDIKVLLKNETTLNGSQWYWDSSGDCYCIIGYRFPDFPAVHTPAQQQQPATPQSDTTKQRLATMYHGWCDVAPDSVAECITDVAKVLYPTDAERCEAEFQKWRSDPDGVDSDPTTIWHAAWQAAKQQKP